MTALGEERDPTARYVTARYVTALSTQSARFAEVLRGADLRQQVPTCPDWTLHQLAEHLGRAHRWAGAIVSRRASTLVEVAELAIPPAPDSPEELGRWVQQGTAELVAAITQVGGETPVWTWFGEGRVSYWARRMAHETAVHRADAELARGHRYDLEPDLAADALSEWLEIVCSPQARAHRPELAQLRGTGQLLHLHSTDPELGHAGEWIIRRTPDGPVWEHGHAKGDVALRGAAVHLMLVILRRLTPQDAPVQILGDQAVLEHWLAHTRF